MNKFTLKLEAQDATAFGDLMLYFGQAAPLMPTHTMELAGIQMGEWAERRAGRLFIPKPFSAKLSPSEAYALHCLLKASVPLREQYFWIDRVFSDLDRFVTSDRGLRTTQAEQLYNQEG